MYDLSFVHLLFVGLYKYTDKSLKNAGAGSLKSAWQCYLRLDELNAVHLLSRGFD